MSWAGRVVEGPGVLAYTTTRDSTLAGPRGPDRISSACPLTGFRNGVAVLDLRSAVSHAAPVRAPHPVPAPHQGLR